MRCGLAKHIWAWRFSIAMTGPRAPRFGSREKGETDEHCLDRAVLEEHCGACVAGRCDRRVDGDGRLRAGRLAFELGNDRRHGTLRRVSVAGYVFVEFSVGAEGFTVGDSAGGRCACGLASR